MNFEELLEKTKGEVRAEEKLDAAKKLISALRPYANERQIYDQLVKHYGTDFSEDELKHLLQTTK